MNRYFFAHNANRLIAGIRFEPIDVQGGTLYGVFAASGDLATALGDVSTNPNSAVWEITEPEYVDRLKKKSPNFENSTSWQPPQQPSVPLRGPGAVVVQEPSVRSLPATQTAAQAIEVVDVSPPAPPSSVVTVDKGRKAAK